MEVDSERVWPQEPQNREGVFSRHMLRCAWDGAELRCAAALLCSSSF